MIWKQETSPGYEERFFDFYTMSALPTMIFNGDYQFETGDTMEGIYELLSERNSPLYIDGVMEYIDNNEVRASVQVSIVNSLTTEDNRIIFFLCQHDNDPYLHTLELDKSDDLSLDISVAGEESIFEHVFSVDSSWLLENLRIVAAVQSWDSKTILQAAQLEIHDIIQPDFWAEITSGAPSLEVRFQNESLPVYSLDLIEWDFESDGIIDSYEKHPVTYYDEPGIYSVTMQITKNGQTESITKEDYITVNNSEGISGKVSGIWNEANSPYFIVDTVTVPPDFTLCISAGTELIFSEDTALVINGSLIVEGNAQPAQFTSYSFWNGIKICNAADSCRISGARVTNTVQGAFYIDNSEVEISNCQIISNSSQSTAPAIHVLNAPMINIFGNFISQNCNNSYVGAIGLINSDAIIQNNLIVNNSGNLASVLGLEEDSSASLLNNTISHNTGGSLAFIHSSSISVQNSILQHDGNLFIQIASIPDVSYSCLSSNYPGTGNISSDPMFTSPSPGSGIEFSSQPTDWIHLSNSPCIDAGNPDEIFNDLGDTEQPGFAQLPAQGTLRNDIGVFGGRGFDHLMNIVCEDEDVIFKPDLLSVAPNPFNPSTTMIFHLEENSHVSLMIYNTRGQRIKTLADGYHAKGYGKYIWSGANDQGCLVASGIYFCQLITDKTNEIKKITLIK